MLTIYQPAPRPRKLGDVPAEIFTARGWGRRSARLQLEKAWADVVEPRFRDHTRVLLVRKGVLEIEVNQAIVMQELSSFHKRKLLEKMQRALPSTPINELRF